MRLSELSIEVEFANRFSTKSIYVFTFFANFLLRMLSILEPLD